MTRAAIVAAAGLFATCLVFGAAGAASGAGAAGPDTGDPSAVAGIGQDLPKVLYVVPWKDPQPPPSAAPRVRIDEDIFRTLDRDEFRRRIGLADDAPGMP